MVRGPSVNRITYKSGFRTAESPEDLILGGNAVRLLKGVRMGRATTGSYDLYAGRRIGGSLHCAEHRSAGERRRGDGLGRYHK